MAAPSVDAFAGLTVLIDDVRLFKDGRACLVAQTSSEAIGLLESLEGKRIRDLWLDYDLLHGDTAKPVVEYLTSRAKAGRPLDVEHIEVHSARIREGHQMVVDLVGAGYPATRNFAANMFSHRANRTASPDQARPGLEGL